MLAFMRGQEENNNRRKQLVDFPSRAKTIKHRHGDIKNHEVGLQFPRPFNSFSPVYRLTADFNVASGFQNCTDARSPVSWSSTTKIRKGLPSTSKFTCDGQAREFTGEHLQSVLSVCVSGAISSRFVRL